MSDLIDALFDELAKRVKEAPGWLLLSLGSAYALHTEGIESIAHKLELHISEERSTIAALLAIGLLSLGDVLDTVVFPRETDSTQNEKILGSSLLALAALACAVLFMTSSIERVLLALCAALLWLLVVLILGGLLGPEDPGETGWPLLQTQKLVDARKSARGALKLGEGVYGVSLALARKAGRYRFGNALWLKNEFGKFFRSLVFPLVGVCVIEFIRREPFPASLAGAGVVVAFILYWRLKVSHMCLLYNTATQLAGDAENFKPPPTPMANKKLAFFWKEKFAASQPG